MTLKGPAGDILLARAMDFYDSYLAWKENRPENFVYGTWFEEKVGIHRLVPGPYAVRFECVGANPLSRARGSDGPGYDCGLDGISFRRFPWDDLPGMMRRYLAEEARLFAARIEQAKATVAELEAAVERFRRDTGDYPRNLEELAVRPARLAGTPGNWPYVADLARDPWGQAYRFAQPGVFNPDRFDVYSVHGNSRSPDRWIGNWPTPYVWRDAIEGESLTPKPLGPAVRVMAQEVRPASPPPLSGGKLLFLHMKAGGDAVELGLPASIRPGRYAVAIRLVTSWDYAVVRLSLNGEPLGEPVDAYSPKIGTRLVQRGEVDIRPSENVIRLEAVGRNPASTGFAAGIDAIRLLPVASP